VTVGEKIAVVGGHEGRSREPPFEHRAAVEAERARGTLRPGVAWELSQQASPVVLREPVRPLQERDRRRGLGDDPRAGLVVRFQGLQPLKDRGPFGLEVLAGKVADQRIRARGVLGESALERQQAARRQQGGQR
jgi:hypothetical protein